MKLYNLARMTSATAGTGTLTLGVAVSGYLTFALAGVADGDVVLYGIKDGANSEVGWGTYTASGTTLSRNVYKSTNSNALISCSGSQEVYVTALGADGGDLLPGSTTPMRGFDTPINLQLNASVASNILTIAVKGNNGADPSATNPVLIPFRDATASNGDPVWVPITAALSINTNATGATLGTSSTVPFRLWVVAFNNAGTVVLALWQSITGGASPSALALLNEAAVASTTAISGAATAAGTFYTPNGTALTSKAFRIIGHVDYASGLTTAGSYAGAPTTVQLFGPGIRKPGEAFLAAHTQSSSSTATSSSTAVATSVTASVAPSSAPNLLKVRAVAPVLCSNSATAIVTQIRRGTTTGLGSVALSGGFVGRCALVNEVLDAPGMTSSTTYTVYALSVDNTNSVTYNIAVGLTAIGIMQIEEIMA